MSTPWASRTIKAPAATSHDLVSYDQKASKCPAATEKRFSGRGTRAAGRTAAAENLEESQHFARRPGRTWGKTSGHDGLRELRGLACPYRLAIEKHPLAGRGQIALVVDRSVDDANQQLAVSLESDRDGIFGDTVHEIRGAVQRIDDPPQARWAGRKSHSFSSARKPWSGKAPRITSRTARCEATSASVTRSAGSFSRAPDSTGVIAKNLAADAGRTFAQFAELGDKRHFPHA